MSAERVEIPLVNPNEPEALLAAIQVQEKEHVQAGAPLFTLETTKSTLEVVAEIEGFVLGLQAETGQTVQAGDLFCYLAASADWQPPTRVVAQPAEASSPSIDLPAQLRITQPALQLARAHNLDLNDLPVDTLVTEKIVRSRLESPPNPRQAGAPPSQPFDPTAILIYGGGGHGKSLIELLQALGAYRIVGVIDDSLPVGSSILGIPVLGGSVRLEELHASGVHLAVNAVGGIGNINARLGVFAKLAEAGFACPAVVHPTAWIEPSAELAPGVQVLPLAYVGSAARLGFGCIVNTGAIISHDCQIGEYANLSPGATLAGGVILGPRTLVGMRATLNLAVQVGAGARIGNGATVKSDVPAGGVVPAGSIWPRD
jgi:acetyltransferase EpsM